MTTSTPSDRLFRIDGRPTSKLLTYVAEYSARVPFDGTASWDKVLFAGASTPESLAKLYDHPETADGTALPNQAFLLAFMQMFDTQRALLNMHPESHRELYYRGLLGLAETPAVPDTVAVSFHLEEEATNLDLPKGLLLDGGQDLAGNTLNYALAQALLANHGTFTDLRWCLPASSTGTTATSRIVYDALDGPLEWPASGVKLFGADAQEDRGVEIGRVVSSPALAMTGGPRRIMVWFDSPVNPTGLSGAVSGELGWMPLTPPGSSNPVSEVIFELSATAGPIVAPHGLDGFVDDAPVLKLTRSDGQDLPPVLTISTYADSIGNLELFTVAGEQDPTSTFLPFGQVPVVGCAIDLSAREFYENPSPFELAIIFDWIGLPPVSFHEWYKGYPGAPIDNFAFTVQVQRVWHNGAVANIAEPKALFGGVGDVPPLSNTVRITLPAALEGAYDPEAGVHGQQSWLRLVLTPKDFLASEYFAAASQANPVGSVNPPFTPQVKSMLARYYCADVRPDAQYRLTPYGYEDAARTPRSVVDPEFYVGLSNLKPGEDIALYWQLQSPGRLDIAWEYLNAANEWESLAAILSDQTNGLFRSGLWRVSLPSNASLDAPAMPAGRCWIRGVVKPPLDGLDGETAYPFLVGLCTNAATATLVTQDTEIDPSHYQSDLPAGTITSTVEPVDGLENVSQPWPGAGGAPAETADSFNDRVAELLRNRGRALTSHDMHVLLLEEFPEVYDLQLGEVRYNADTADFLGEEHRRLHGIVIPQNGKMDNADPLRPAFGAARLTHMADYIRSVDSPWLELVLANPTYRDVATSFSVRFAAGTNLAYGTQLVRETLSHAYMPWAYDDSSIVRPGYDIDYYGVIQTIQSLEIVESVTDLVLGDSRTSIVAEPDEVLILTFAPVVQQGSGRTVPAVAVEVT